jgi:hypothetical protein
MSPPRVPPLDVVKERVVSDHARIRKLLDRIESMAQRHEEAGRLSAPSPELTEAVWSLFLTFDDHLAMEERDLVPHLERHGGTTGVGRLHEEHRQQRTVLLALVDECDCETMPDARVASDLAWLIRNLRRDMDAEENEIDRLRDDGFQADQFTG